MNSMQSEQSTMPSDSTAAKPGRPKTMTKEERKAKKAAYAREYYQRNKERMDAASRERQATYRRLAEIGKAIAAS